MAFFLDKGKDKVQGEKGNVLATCSVAAVAGPMGSS